MKPRKKRKTKQRREPSEPQPVWLVSRRHGEQVASPPGTPSMWYWVSNPAGERIFFDRFMDDKIIWTRHMSQAARFDTKKLALVTCKDLHTEGERDNTPYEFLPEEHEKVFVVDEIKIADAPSICGVEASGFFVDEVSDVSDEVMKKAKWFVRDRELRRGECETHKQHHTRINGIVHRLDATVESQLATINQLEEEVISKLEKRVIRLAKDKADLMRRVNELKSQCEDMCDQRDKYMDAIHEVTNAVRSID